MSDDKRRDIPINRNYPKKVREINIIGKKQTTLDIGRGPLLMAQLKKTVKIHSCST